MDTLNHYRDIIEQTLSQYSSASANGAQYETVFDRVRDHYLVVTVGWGKQERIYGVLAHIDLIGGKAWVQHDRTEEGLANELRDAGIPTDHIVLGFRIPEVRQHTGYAVA